MSEFQLNVRSTPRQSDVRADVPCLAAWQLALLFLLAFLMVFSRRPDALFDPQFRAEDGTVWFAQAYNSGWFTALARPQTGYFQTLPRLAAAAALLVPLRFAPLLMNVIGLLIQVLPILVLLSSRSVSWGSLRFRSVLAFVYLALPNSFEIHATVTNAQWHLAFLSALIVLANEPRSRAWCTFDLVFLILGGLTGPFCLFLSIVAFLSWFLCRGAWRAIQLVVLSATAIIQASALMFGNVRHPGPGLGASALELIKILGGQVYLGALIGANSLATRHGTAVLVVLCTATIFGTALFIIGAITGGRHIRLFTVFALLIFAASLSNPMESATMPQWQSLLIDRGTRYWFFPMLAFLWSIIWCAQSPRPLLKRTAAILLVFATVGVVRNWRCPPYPPSHFSASAAIFSQARPGSIVRIPIYPNWTMELHKKPPH